MSRAGLMGLGLALFACSTGAQDQSSKPATGGGAGEKIAVPGGDTAKGPAVVPPAGDNDRAKLHAAEGTLAVDAPADAKAGAETTAKIIVKPGAGYHVNTEYPIKLTLTAPDGVAVPKAEFTAGGHDKAKGDAEQLDEQNLTIAVKLTPSKTGSYTVNGSFKFAVCDKDQCLPKKEQIAIVVAAK